MYKVTLADLLAVNKMTVKSVINPGSQLALPANAVAPQTAPAAAATSASGLTYTVKFGDFLAGIAAKYKVKLPDLLAVNKLKANSLILPGAKLAMPAGAVPPAATSTPVVQSSAGPAGVVVAYAYAQLGKPYRFFTAGPATFDCSGLVKTAFAQIGIQMVHHAASQASYGTAVDIWSEPIKAGDLVFMTHPRRSRDQPCRDSRRCDALDPRPEARRCGAPCADPAEGHPHLRARELIP